MSDSRPALYCPAALPASPCAGWSPRHKATTRGSFQGRELPRTFSTKRAKGVFLVLVLSRKKGEGIRVNDDVEIVVIEIRGDKVRLGIRADKSIPVHREEVYQAIQRRKAEAAA